MKIIKKIICGFLMCVGAIVLLASCSSKTDEPKAVDSSKEDKTAQVEQAPEQQENPKDNVFKVGEAVNFKDVEYTVTSVEKSAGQDFSQPKDGCEYVIVTVSINNTSKKKVSYNPIDWKMINSNGQEESETFSIIDSDTSLNSGDLMPGGTVSGTIVFEEPVDDPDLKLVYYDNMFDDLPSITFSLN